MKILNSKIILGAILGCTLFLGSCEESLSEKLGREANIMISFKVTQVQVGQYSILQLAKMILRSKSLLILTLLKS